MPKQPTNQFGKLFKTELEGFLENPEDNERGKHNAETMEGLVSELKEAGKYVDTQEHAHHAEAAAPKAAKKIRKASK